MNTNALLRACILATSLVFFLAPAQVSAQSTYRLTDIGTLDGAEEMYGAEINQSGQVTGMAVFSGGGSEHAYLWDGSTLMALGTLGRHGERRPRHQQCRAGDGPVENRGARIACVPVGRQCDAGSRHVGR